MVTRLHKLNASRQRTSRAFTLIEMLVVMGVIAILAGIIIGVLPAAQQKSIRSRVKTEMKAIETAIDSYKAKHNFFPPDNPNDASRPPLFYELTGTTNDTAQYWSKYSPNDPPLNQSAIKSIFGIDGFMNTSQAEDEVAAPNFYRTLIERQVREMPPANGQPAYKLLVAPRYGMDRQPALWCYDSSSPTNNAGEFDLWAEVNIGGDRVVIGNWEK